MRYVLVFKIGLLAFTFQHADKAASAEEVMKPDVKYFAGFKSAFPGMKSPVLAPDKEITIDEARENCHILKQPIIQTDTLSKLLSM